MTKGIITLKSVDELRKAIWRRVRAASSNEDDCDVEVVEVDDTQLRAYWEQALAEQDDTLVKETIMVFGDLVDDDAQLERILVARKYKEMDSVDLFLEQVRFRARYHPENIRPDDIANALPSGAWRLCGHSKGENCVISNYKLEFWDPDAYGGDGNDYAAAVEEYVRYIVYMIELMIGAMKPEPVPQQFVVLFDLNGFRSTMVFRRNIHLMIRKLIYVAQAQYPERLRKVLLVNAPYGFSTAWTLIRQLLDEKTASKISFATKAQLTQFIDSDVLSVAYGGTHEEYPIPSRELQEEIRMIREEDKE